MLVVVQHPLLDVRSLVDQETYRVRAPMWPRPLRVYGRQSLERSRNDFVRLVGPVRRRSNPSTWISEGFYVDARRGVCIAGIDKALRRETITAIKPVFRRFYHDGTVGRLEIGFRHHGPSSDLLATAATGSDLVKTVMSANTWLRGEPRAAEPLIYFGPIFAQRLLSATTRFVRPDGAPVHDIPRWWVMAGDPAVIVEDMRHGSPGRIETYHRWQKLADIQVSVWTIANPEVHLLDASDQLRRIRIYLSHLHSELAALELALSLCAAGRLDGSQAGLRDYLDRACGRLLREQRDGMAQREYLSNVLGTMQTSYADKIDALRELSTQIDSKGLSRKVRDVASLLEILSTKMGRTEIKVGDTYKTEIRAGNVAGISTGSGQVETGGISQLSISTDEDLTALSNKVVALVAAIRGQVPDDEADAAEDTAEGLRREIEKGNPDKEKVGRRVDKLLSIATRAGAAGAALAGAATAIRAAIGM